MPEMSLSDPQTVSQIRQHSRQLVRELDILNGACLGTGYTLSQCHVLLELSTHGSLNLSELTDLLLIDKSNASRTVKKLVQLGLVSASKASSDNRQKFFSLTRNGVQAVRENTGLANKQVEQALENLSQPQQQQVILGLQLYAGALRKSRLQAGYNIRLIQKRDNPQVARLIREVLTEFQAVGEGYSIRDAEVDDMWGNYREERSCYYVISHGDQIVGGGGIAPLTGGGKLTCELRKMFFLPTVRGLGLGRRLLSLLMDEANNRGYKKCYLETLDRMWRANKLYQKNGFELLDKPRGKTGHCSCDRWYMRNL